MGAGWACASLPGALRRLGAVSGYVPVDPISKSGLVLDFDVRSSALPSGRRSLCSIGALPCTCSAEGSEDGPRPGRSPLAPGPPCSLLSAGAPPVPAPRVWPALDATRLSCMPCSLPPPPPRPESALGAAGHRASALSSASPWSLEAGRVLGDSSVPAAPGWHGALGESGLPVTVLPRPQAHVAVTASLLPPPQLTSL